MAKLRIGTIVVLKNDSDEVNGNSCDKNGYALLALPDKEEDVDILYINITRSVLSCFHCDCLTEEIIDIVTEQLPGKVVACHFDEYAMEYTNSGDLSLRLSFASEELNEEWGVDRAENRTIWPAIHSEKKAGGLMDISSVCLPERPKKVSQHKREDPIKASVEGINPIIWCSPERPKKKRVCSNRLPEIPEEQEHIHAAEQVRIIDALRNLANLFKKPDEYNELS